MKFELLLLLITGSLVYNAYYDGYLVNTFKVNKKYIEILGYLFIALTIYLFIKKRPNDSRSMMVYANNIIKYMPIDKGAKSMLNPLFDFTKDYYSHENDANTIQPNTPQMKRMLQSGGRKHSTETQKRSVSQAKKKLIASQQSWRCGHCNQQLDHTYEVDHIMDLQYGGSNEVSNLVALCRNCHGKKTMASKM